jgi:hypothetical protein
MSIFMARTIGDLEIITDKLMELIPAQGACENARGKNKHLDKFRRATNVVYDIFNNGLCNRANQLRVLDNNLRVHDLPVHSRQANKWDIIEDRIGGHFRKIIIEAAKEQGFIDKRFEG